MSYRILTGLIAACGALLIASGAAPAQSSTYSTECVSGYASAGINPLGRPRNYVTECSSTYTRAPQPAHREATTPPETFKNEAMYFDNKAETRKAARLRKEGYRAPGEVASPCLPPTRMTARDGCQP